MKLAIKILFIVSIILTLFLFAEISQPLPSTTSAFSNNVNLKKDFKIDFEVQLDGCYKIEMIPLHGSIVGNDFNIKAQLNPKTGFQEINSVIEIKDGNLQIGNFCADPGDDFELKIKVLDDRLINKEVLLLIDANDAMPSQNLVWAKELRPLYRKLFYIFLSITLVFAIALIFVKKKST